MIHHDRELRRRTVGTDSRVDGGVGVRTPRRLCPVHRVPATLGPLLQRGCRSQPDRLEQRRQERTQRRGESVSVDGRQRPLHPLQLGLVARPAQLPHPLGEGERSGGVTRSGDVCAAEPAGVGLVPHEAGLLGRAASPVAAVVVGLERHQPAVHVGRVEVRVTDLTHGRAHERDRSGNVWTRRSVAFGHASPAAQPRLAPPSSEQVDTVDRSLHRSMTRAPR